MFNKKIASELAVGTILLISIVVGTIIWMENERAVVGDKPSIIENTPVSATKEERKEEDVACIMDAKLCDDGSSVGRIGPNCEFAECPAIEKTANDYKSDPDALYEKTRLAQPNPNAEARKFPEFSFNDYGNNFTVVKNTFDIISEDYFNEKSMLDAVCLIGGDNQEEGWYGFDNQLQFVKSVLKPFVGKKGIRYSIIAEGDFQGGNGYSFVIIPNEGKYDDEAKFKRDFNFCDAGAMYPLFPGQMSEKYLEFDSGCGTGFKDDSGLPNGCDYVQWIVGNTIRLN